MTAKRRLTLYPEHENGEIKANVVGAFMRGGEGFYVIRPGYDAQGRRRQSWTQIAHDGVPIWEWKRIGDLSAILDHFDKLWAQHLGGDPKLLAKALTQTKALRRRTFRDGVSGETPAPSITRDGREPGIVYPS